MKRVLTVKIKILLLVSFILVFASSWKLFWTIEAIRTLPKVVSYAVVFYIADTITIIYFFSLLGIIQKD